MKSSLHKIAIVDEIGSLDYILEYVQVSEIYVPHYQLDNFKETFNHNFRPLHTLRAAKADEICIGLTPTIDLSLVKFDANIKIFIDSKLSWEGRCEKLVALFSDPEAENIEKILYLPFSLDYCTPAISVDSIKVLIKKRKIEQSKFRHKLHSESPFFISEKNKNVIFLAEHYYRKQEAHEANLPNYEYQSRAIFELRKALPNEWIFFVKRHPADRCSWQVPENTILLDKNFDIESCLHLFSLVFGIDTVLLLRSAKKKIPTFSIQPVGQNFTHQLLAPHLNVNVIDLAQVSTIEWRQFV